jgi:hypothetical protein
MKIYCLVCKKKTATKVETSRTSKNGKAMKGGTCAVCGKNKCVFVKKA